MSIPAFLSHTNQHSIKCEPPFLPSLIFHNCCFPIIIVPMILWHQVDGAMEYISPKHCGFCSSTTIPCPFLNSQQNPKSRMISTSSIPADLTLRVTAITACISMPFITDVSREISPKMERFPEPWSQIYSAQQHSAENWLWSWWVPDSSALISLIGHNGAVISYKSCRKLAGSPSLSKASAQMQDHSVLGGYVVISLGKNMTLLWRVLCCVWMWGFCSYECHTWQHVCTILWGNNADILHGASYMHLEKCATAAHTSK